MRPCLCGYLLAAAVTACGADANEPLEPLAEVCRADVGIETDPSVILAENFDGEGFRQWDELGSHPETLALVHDAERDSQALEIAATLGENTGGHLFKRFDRGYDEVYARFYVRFAEDCDYVHHFVHLVAENTTAKWPSGGAGIRPEGNAKFSTGLEPSGKWGRYPPPGAWNFYSYWWEMKQAPDGKYWGNSFEPREPIVPERGRWYCVEMRLKSNTAPNDDGEQTFWIDGVKAGDFKGIRWRSDNALKINAFWLLYYVTGNVAKNAVNRVRFDDIVVATRYVGPKTPASR